MRKIPDAVEDAPSAMIAAKFLSFDWYLFAIISPVSTRNRCSKSSAGSCHLQMFSPVMNPALSEHRYSTPCLWCPAGCPPVQQIAGRHQSPHISDSLCRSNRGRWSLLVPVTLDWQPMRVSGRRYLPWPQCYSPIETGSCGPGWKRYWQCWPQAPSRGEIAWSGRMVP